MDEAAEPDSSLPSQRCRQFFVFAQTFVARRGERARAQPLVQVRALHQLNPLVRNCMRCKSYFLKKSEKQRASQ